MSIPDFFLCSLYELYVILEAHNNHKKEQWYHTRMIAYCNMVASWGNPKKRPPSINKYMPLDSGNTIEDKWVEERLEILRQAQKEYNKKVSLNKKLVN